MDNEFETTDGENEDQAYYVVFFVELPNGRTHSSKSRKFERKDVKMAYRAATFATKPECQFFSLLDDYGVTWMLGPELIGKCMIGFGVYLDADCSYPISMEELDNLLYGDESE